MDPEMMRTEHAYQTTNEHLKIDTHDHLKVETPMLTPDYLKV